MTHIERQFRCAVKNTLRKFALRFELFSANRSIKASLYNVRPLQRQRGVCICSQNTNIPRSHERKQASTNQKDSYDHLYCRWQFSAIPVIWDSRQCLVEKRKLASTNWIQQKWQLLNIYSGKKMQQSGRHGPITSIDRVTAAKLADLVAKCRVRFVVTISRIDNCFSTKSGSTDIGHLSNWLPLVRLNWRFLVNTKYMLIPFYAS